MDTPNYNQTTVSGESWQRAMSVHIDNPLGGLPSINFVEEKVIVVGGGIFHEPVGSLTTGFDPANPLHGQIYTILNDLYVALREVRDSTPTVEPVL